MFTLNILHENDNFLIIDKPSGLVVNRSKTSPDNTLQDLLESSKYFTPENKEESVPAGDDFTSRTGIVHRLDKDTSGLIFVALNEKTFVNMQKKFKSRKVKKEYIAVVLGKLPNDVIEINAPIGRDNKNRTKFVVSKSGKEAFTRVALISTTELAGRKVTSVLCKPTTGRTHQLRVHLCALGTPILGDKIYGGRKQLKWAREEASIDRLMLHASKLEFELDDIKYSFFADAPSEFGAFLARD